MSDNTARKRRPSAPLAIPCRPFVKWVGGKSQLLMQLLERLPSDINTYYEPFIGGGALYFAAQPNQSVISDLNPELINAYEVIKNDVDALIRDLRKHKYEEKYFYTIRNVDRTSAYKRWSPVRRASRLIYLNKSCFNGLYRVNSKGEFNSPFGRYTNPTILDEKNLRACNQALQNATIRLANFEYIEDSASAGDFVYFDPPYVPLSETAYFTSYGRDGFDMKSQKALHELCVRLDKRGVKFMLSNSSAPIVLTMYRNFKVELVAANRSINSKGEKRGAIKEVIVTNFK